MRKIIITALFAIMISQPAISAEVIGSSSGGGDGYEGMSDELYQAHMDYYRAKKVYEECIQSGNPCLLQKAAYIARERHLRDLLKKERR